MKDQLKGLLVRFYSTGHKAVTARKNQFADRSKSFSGRETGNRIDFLGNYYKDIVNIDIDTIKTD